MTTSLLLVKNGDVNSYLKTVSKRWLFRQRTFFNVEYLKKKKESISLKNYKLERLQLIWQRLLRPCLMYQNEIRIQCYCPSGKNGVALVANVQEYNEIQLPVKRNKIIVAQDH